MTELHYLSATEALRLFRARELSPVELLDAVIAQAEKVDPLVNALCHTFYEQAREQARKAEACYLGRGPEPRPLEGIPLAVKEEEAIAGQPWTEGSLLHKDRVAEHSSAFGQRMLDSGAVVHARTTAPEFACTGFTRSKIHGITRNPWNPEYGVGGSSGGAAAALASGTTTLASGSDIGGSIRTPASFNGVVGFKPPYGRVPVAPPFNLDTYCHSGPLARTVADTALFQNTIAGPHPSDVTTLRPAYVLPEHFDGIEGLRIALSTDLGSWPLDPEIRTNTVAVADALRSAGAVVDEVDLVVPRKDVQRAAAIHFNQFFAPAVGAATVQYPELTTAYAAEFSRWVAENAADSTIEEIYLLDSQVGHCISAVLEPYDALICPTVATRGLLADEEYLQGTGIEVGGEYLAYYYESFMTLPFNIMSRCPVLSVPSGFARNGVPTGVQIVGRTYDDETVFRIGTALERVRPWPMPGDERP